MNDPVPGFPAQSVPVKVPLMWLPVLSTTTWAYVTGQGVTCVTVKLKVWPRTAPLESWLMVSPSTLSRWTNAA